jgi:hypothetical protein
MIIWWSKHVGVILNVLVCDIWINVLLQTSALVGPYSNKEGFRWRVYIQRVPANMYEGKLEYLLRDFTNLTLSPRFT